LYIQAGFLYFFFNTDNETGGLLINKNKSFQTDFNWFWRKFT